MHRRKRKKRKKKHIPSNLSIQRVGGRPGAEYEVLRVEGVESGDEIRVDPEISFNKVSDMQIFQLSYYSQPLKMN